ncbi:centrosomal protein of 89 kDa [Pelobates fuscus]|uniref:centrosomal protein of 89 kDa n=1 Tax=Pelobates fuscus TaxID=191477 RepID=UPI002FE4B2B5
MNFSFSRRDRSPFRHIAHGLIPAATVAPRSAVPRTPPPRSPNPSPERPRSALAAAILLTSLTGRTVALPQPRQRSFSENDSSYVEDTSMIDPYATARDLGLEQNWKDYADRKNLGTPITSYDFEDEDTEQEMSDIEREQVLQESQRITSSPSKEPIYAVPLKEKRKHNAPVSEDQRSSSNSPAKDNLEDVPEISDTDHREESRVVSDAPVTSPTPSSDIETSRRSPRRKQTEGVKSESRVDAPVTSPTPSSDIETSRRSPRRKQTEGVKSGGDERLNQVPTGASKEASGKLKARIHHLTSDNTDLTNQLEEVRQQMKAMRIKIKNLKNEKRALTESLQTQNTEADTAELISLQEQAQELVDENDALKMTVHRLNVELSRYQTKYRPLSKEEQVKIHGLPQRGPPPPWLLDMKYLSPLLLAYEDRIKEKDGLIQSFEEEMTNIKTRIKKVIEENEQLHQHLEENRPVSTNEWQLRQTQAKLLLEENQVLMEKLEVQQAKERETHSQHIQEVSQLTKQVMVLEAKKQSQEDELSDMQKQQDVLRSKYEDLKSKVDGWIDVNEHVAMVNELKSNLQQEKDKSKADIQELMDKIYALQEQKKRLHLERNDLLADNKTLEAEVETVKKTNRKLQRKVGQLKNQLEDAMDKEVAAHQYLANLVTLAETISGERDELIQIAHGLETEKNGVLNKMVEGNVRLGRLQEMVKVYRQKTAGELRGISHKLTKQEEDFAGKASQHQREMRNLRRLLQDRQESLDEVLLQKRQIEGELDVIWESTTHENEHLKALLQKAMKQSKSKPINASQVFAPHSEQEYSFGYCDVNSSSHARDSVQ